MPDVIVHKAGRNSRHATGSKFHRLSSTRCDAAPARARHLRWRAARPHKGGEGHAPQQRLQEARWFIKNIQQRFDTIPRVSRARHRRAAEELLAHGELAMRPLVLREIADELGLHESTISRVTTASTWPRPFGTFELKYFFGSAWALKPGQRLQHGGARAHQTVRRRENPAPQTAERQPDWPKCSRSKALNAPAAPWPNTAKRSRWPAMSTRAALAQGVAPAAATLPESAPPCVPNQTGTPMNQLNFFSPAPLVSRAAGRRGACHHRPHGQRPAGGGAVACCCARSWREALLLNLRSRLAQRVLVQLAHTPYRSENDLYALASAVAWRSGSPPSQSFKIEVTAQHSPLQEPELRGAEGQRRGGRPLPPQERRAPRCEHPVARCAHPPAPDHRHRHALHRHQGEPLFKRGWREDKGDAPLKETLAAAMIAASGWDAAGEQGRCTTLLRQRHDCHRGRADRLPHPAGMLRRFAFEKLLPFQGHVWTAIKTALTAQYRQAGGHFGSDVATAWSICRAQRRARGRGRAAVQPRRRRAAAHAAPDTPGLMLLNPPYGERIEAGTGGRPTSAAAASAPARNAQTDDGGEFFSQLPPTGRRTTRLDGLDAHARPQAAPRRCG